MLFARGRFAGGVQQGPSFCLDSVLVASPQAGVVDVPIFAFFMGNIDTDAPRGVMTLGGVNQTHYEGAYREARVMCQAYSAKKDTQWNLKITAPPR